MEQYDASAFYFVEAIVMLSRQNIDDILRFVKKSWPIDTSK